MTDKENRVDEVIEKKLITDCSREAVKIDINLDEFHKILRPIVKYCTKESIATGKAWILQTGRDLKSARLICKYISARVLRSVFEVKFVPKSFSALLPASRCVYTRFILSMMFFTMPIVGTIGKFYFLYSISTISGQF